MTNNLGTAPLPREPYAGLPDLPLFNLTSTDLETAPPRPPPCSRRSSACPAGRISLHS